MGSNPFMKTARDIVMNKYNYHKGLRVAELCTLELVPRLGGISRGLEVDEGAARVP
jgi:hypothetical protein